MTQRMAVNESCGDVSPVWPEREVQRRAGSHLVVSVHHLEASAGLLLLHVVQRALQAEDHVVRLLDHLHGDKDTPTRSFTAQMNNMRIEWQEVTLQSVGVQLKGV